jgi:hypothetical protein
MVPHNSFCDIEDSKTVTTAVFYGSHASLQVARVPHLRGSHASFPVARVPYTGHIIQCRREHDLKGRPVKLPHTLLQRQEYDLMRSYLYRNRNI